MALPLPASPWFTEDHARPMERSRGLGFALAVHSQTHWPMYAIEMVDQNAQDRNEEEVLRVMHRLIVVSPDDRTWDIRGVFAHEAWLPVMRAIVSRQVDHAPWVERGYPMAAPMVRRPVDVEEVLAMAPSDNKVPLNHILKLNHDRVRHSAALQRALRETLTQLAAQ